MEPQRNRDRVQEVGVAMSIVVEGVIDLPMVDLKDTQTLLELLEFLHENSLLNLSKWIVQETQEGIRLTHKHRNWSWIEISKEGKIKIDEHYKETVKFKDELLSAIREYYPMFKKALEIIEIEKNGLTNYRLSYDKEKEKLILEVEDA